MLGEQYFLISAAARLELFKQVPGPIPQPEKIQIVVTVRNYKWTNELGGAPSRLRGRCVTVEGFDIFKEGVSNDQFFRPKDLVKFHEVPVEDQDEIVVYR